MPKKSVKSRKPKLRNLPQNPSDLEDFIREASEVKQLSQHTGWTILERDLSGYRETLVDKLAYINPTRPEFNELRILFLASDKLLNMVNDYEANRDIAIQLLNKLQNTDLTVPLDMDNEIPNERGESKDGL